MPTHDVGRIVATLRANVATARERKAAIWRELNIMFANQADRAEEEQRVRAEEHAREMALRSELADLHDEPTEITFDEVRQ